MSELIDGYCTPGDERDTDLSAARLVVWLDEARIDRAVIAPQDREIAVRCREGNRRVLAMAASGGGRFVAACTASPWLGDEAVAIVREAVAGGAQMLVLAPALQGFILTDDLTDGLLAAAAEMNLPVYVHTGPHGHAGPTQLALVAQKHGNARFILGHGGSTDHAWDMPAVLRLKLPNVWYETSLIRPWAVPNYGNIIGEDRLIFGSSAPRNVPGFELEHADKHWPRAQHPNTYGPNLAKLLSGVRVP
jgi:predicted TIM-barrel fold metal-dependent hydrolase